MDTHRNPVLWLALGIPLLMIVLIAVGIWLPRFFMKPPQENFLYSAAGTTQPYMNGFYAYIVGSDGVLQRYVANAQDKSAPTTLPVDTRSLYVFNVATGTSKQISFADAQKLKLDPNHMSADGYGVETGNGDGGWLFGGGASDQYLVRGSYSQRLDIAQQFGNIYYDFQFLGWIK